MRPTQYSSIEFPANINIFLSLADPSKVRIPQFVGHREVREVFKHHGS